jgi:acetyl-CoA C-acetyltransferase
LGGGPPSVRFGRPATNEEIRPAPHTRNQRLLANQARAACNLLPMATVITGMARTPIGRFGGAFRSQRAVDLGSAAIGAALERSGVAPEGVDEVLFGHVIQAGTGQITARQAAAGAGVPMTVPATTINKVCLSGMAAIAMGDRSIRLGEASHVVAGGMESMSGAPYVLPSARWGARMFDTTLVDTMMHDGLWCAFDGCTMGESSDRKNRALGIDRAEQDEWAAASHARAAAATESGHFAEEIVPVSVAQPKGDPTLVDADEGIRPDATIDTLGALRAAFEAEGTITAGNASQISDGAAAVILVDEDAAGAGGLPLLARIIAYGQVGGPDATLHERPAEAIQVALKRAGMEVSDLDLVEINEAFASVALWSARLLDLPHDRVNVHGGAVALGHPLGATGARIVVTLVNALRARGGGVGAAALCGGGGQGDALIVEVPG